MQVVVVQVVAPALPIIATTVAIVGVLERGLIPMHLAEEPAAPGENSAFIYDLVSYFSLRTILINYLFLFFFL